MINYIFEKLALIFRYLKIGLITFQARPLFSANFQLESDHLKKQPLIGIIIQGPIVSENNFTYETVKIYQQLFPSQPIILSTWEDEDKQQLALLSSLQIQVVLNKKPLNSGIKHINYQIVSSHNGIKRARKLGCKYVIKTRTDQRMYSNNIFEFCLNMLKKFPVTSGYKQKERILVPSFYSFKYRLYSVTDMLVFGNIDDLDTYFNPALDSRSELNKIVKTPRQFAHARCGEIYLSVNYLAKIGRKLKWTLADSWQTYADHFCVVDQNVFDIYWLKYDCPLEYRHLNYQRMTNKQELTFKEWFNLYVGLKNKKLIPEQTLDSGIDDTVRLETRLI